MSDEQAFSISVPQFALDALQQKLAIASFPSASPQSEDEWDYGVPLRDVERLVARWKDGYDWRSAEVTLNKELPQYTRSIEVAGQGTFTAHYVHKKSENANAIPLLFLHGCQCYFHKLLHTSHLIASARARTFRGSAQDPSLAGLSWGGRCTFVSCRRA